MGKKLKRILTGIQSTGVPHLGNILGAIIPAINFSKSNNVESYFFIADFHSLTQIKDSKLLKLFLVGPISFLNLLLQCFVSGP